MVPSDEALFCLVEEKRKFTQEEIDVRAARWPANLRRDYKTNTAFEREGCAAKQAAGVLGVAGQEADS